MDLMLTHQLSSKNLSIGEKLAMTEEFQKEVALENEKKRLEWNSKGGSSNNEVSLQLECNLKEDDPVRKDSWTDSQIAKKAGVGGSAYKVGKVIKELELIYCIKNGNNQHSSLPNNSEPSQSDLAMRMGMSVDTLRNYKLLVEMILELKENVAQEKCKKIFWTN